MRSVRNDLLAWEVPAHEPVWRPFVAAPPVPWWRQVPAWALASAAAVVLLLGATGSVIAQSMMPERVVARETPTNVVATPVTASPDLTAARMRLAALEEQIADMGARVERVSNRTVSVKTVEGDHTAMVTQLQSDFRRSWASSQACAKNWRLTRPTCDDDRRSLNSV